MSNELDVSNGQLEAVEDEKETSDRSMDAEILVMNRFLKELRKLDEGARPRIMAYLNSRFPPK